VSAGGPPATASCRRGEQGADWHFPGRARLEVPQHAVLQHEQAVAPALGQVDVLHQHAHHYLRAGRARVAPARTCPQGQAALPPHCIRADAGALRRTHLVAELCQARVGPHWVLHCGLLLGAPSLSHSARPRLPHRTLLQAAGGPAAAPTGGQTCTVMGRAVSGGLSARHSDCFTAVHKGASRQFAVRAVGRT